MTNSNVTATNIAAQQIAKLQSKALGSYTLFQAEYAAAETELHRYEIAKARRRETTPYKELAMYKLATHLRSYRDHSRAIFADAIHLYGNDINKLRVAVKQLQEWHGYVVEALHKVEIRLGWTPSDMAIISFQQAGVWKAADDIPALMNAMQNGFERNNLMYWNSCAHAVDFLSDFTAELHANDAGAQRLVEAVVLRSRKRKANKRYTQTDAIILGDKPMTAAMIPHVLNRYLTALIGVEGRVAYELEQAEERRAYAVKEISGMSGEHRRRVVSGYTDLSGTDNKGYVSPGEHERVDVDARQGDEERDVIGVDALNDIAEHQLVAIEEAILSTIAKVGEQAVKADLVATPAVWMYLPDGSPIFHKEEAVAIREAGLEAWRNERREKYFAQLRDDRRYAAMMTPVRDFTIQNIA